MSPAPLGGWGPMGDIWYCPDIIICPVPFGTIDNDWTVIIKCPRHLWEAGALWGTYDIVRTLSFVPDTFRRLDPYGRTYDIVRTLSNVPSHLGQLIMTERSLSNVPGTFGRLGPYGGHWILSEHYQMSHPFDIIKCPFPLWTNDNDWTPIVYIW